MTQTVVRTADPREVLALAEHTLGFRPRESLVLVSLRGPRRRTGLVARLDLPDAAQPGVPDALAERARADGAVDAVLVVHTAEAAPPPGRDGRTRLHALPHAPAVRALRAALRRRGIAPVEAWLASGGAMVSYTCVQACCPPRGRPGDPAATRVAAEMVLAGSAVDADRSTWEQRELSGLRPASAAVRRRVEAAARRPRPTGATGTTGEAGEAGESGEVLAWWSDVLTSTVRAVRGGRPAAEVAGELLTAEAAGRALAALGDRRLRDALLLTLVPGGPEAAGSVVGGGPEAAAALDRVLDPDGPCPAPDPDVLLAAEELLRVLVRAAPPRRRAEPLAVLAWARWWQGAGPSAALAAREALRTDPGHGLADLVLRAVEGAVPPSWVRAAQRGTGGADPGRAPRPGTGEASAC